MERLDLMFDINDVDTMKELHLKIAELENELTEERKVKNELQLKYDELVDILFEKVMKKTEKPKLTREQQIIKNMFNPKEAWK
jgi:hypothetical protein